LTGVNEDTIVVCLTSTKSGCLHSMKYMEYVVTIINTVISLEVQFKSLFLKYCVHSSATVSP